MSICISTIDEFLAGDSSRQEYYKTGRNVREVYISDIEHFCQCGYITLKPKNKFEEFNGGLTVKRSNVKIYKENGQLVKRLRASKSNDIFKVWLCNACGNNWK